MDIEWKTMKYMYSERHGHTVEHAEIQCRAWPYSIYNAGHWHTVKATNIQSSGHTKKHVDPSHPCNTDVHSQCLFAILTRLFTFIPRVTVQAIASLWQLNTPAYSRLTITRHVPGTCRHSTGWVELLSLSIHAGWLAGCSGWCDRQTIVFLGVISLRPWSVGRWIL